MAAALDPLASIPAHGPVVIIADGPARHGAVAEVLRRRRADLHVVAMPGSAAVAHRSSGRSGSQHRRAALRALRSGFAVAFVVNGARALRLPRRWCDEIVDCARRSAAPIVPLRLNPSRALAKRPSGNVEVGAAVPASELAAVGPSARSAYLKLLLESLQPPPLVVTPQRTLAPLAAAVDPARLEAQIDALPRQRVLVQRCQLSVCLTRAGDAPAVMAEIARLRELSFRAAGEGSGNPSDRDAFDDHYEHLFVWHAERREIVGAYRLAFSDDVIRHHGIAGLYSSTLFHYDQRLFDTVGPALELGRSFVAPRWQRSFQPLRMLWAGIAAVMFSRPGLRCLFGPVSISAAYSAVARAVMAQALSHHHGAAELSALVRPRHPPQWPRGAEHHRHVASALADVQRLSRTIARVERGPGLPVLLRQYVELNGRFAGFTVDALFGHTLDGLVFVDVSRIPPAMLARFRSMSAMD
jgi:putative hemolysin